MQIRTRSLKLYPNDIFAVSFSKDVSRIKNKLIKIKDILLYLKIRFQNSYDVNHYCYW